MVRDFSSTDHTPATVLPLAKAILAALPTDGNPVGPDTHGTLVQGLAPDNAAMTLIWTEGHWQYKLWGYAAPAIPMAKSLVRLR